MIYFILFTETDSDDKPLKQKKEKPKKSRRKKKGGSDDSDDELKEVSITSWYSVANYVAIF